MTPNSSRDNKRLPNRRGGRPATANEDRRAEAATVVWMLCVVATVLAELLSLCLYAAMWAINFPEIPVVKVLPGLLLFTALVTGLVAVAMIPLVYRFRRSPPPLAITVFAIASGLIPVVIGLALTLTAS